MEEKLEPDPPEWSKLHLYQFSVDIEICSGASFLIFRLLSTYDELASYCPHTLTAASGPQSEDAVRRLVEVILAGVRPSSH